ncbi:MAG: PhzF family phenazine biosynthesis protein [Thermoleophilaceae bacterium]|nr:PhzF family phenazine biosynthesis protein [Thermoleophilaceae bacterium]
MAVLHLLRVFCDAHGGGGNPLGVFLEGAGVPAGRRQAVAAELGLSETVFVDDAAAGAIRIFTPAAELDFAGHPTVGTAWLLARERAPVGVLLPPAGEVPVRYAGDETFVVGRPEWGPQFDWSRLESADAVDELARPGGSDNLAAWAYADEPAGLVRARVFPLAVGIDEDEATGAAAVQLATRVGREIEIRQGRGSRILARPAGGGRAEVGGRTVLDDVRDHPVP